MRDAISTNLPNLKVVNHTPVANLIGATWARLVPTVISLAFYFCLADAILIVQCLYYNYHYSPLSSQSPPAQISPSEDPRQPLLAPHVSHLGLPGQGKQHSPTDLPDEDLRQSSRSRIWMVNTASIIGICLVGTAGWVSGFLTQCPRRDDTDSARR